jgi:hypothetical protein
MRAIEDARDKGGSEWAPVRRDANNHTARAIVTPRVAPSPSRSQFIVQARKQFVVSIRSKLQIEKGPMFIDPRFTQRSSRACARCTGRHPRGTNCRSKDVRAGHTRRRRKYAQSDLLLCVLNRVRAVADVTADGESKVATNGAWIGFNILHGA